MDDLDSIRIFGLGLIAWVAVLVLLVAGVSRAVTTGIGAAAGGGAVPAVRGACRCSPTRHVRLNSGLDHGPATTRTAQIQRIARQDRELFFAPSKPGRIHDKVGVSAEVYRSVKVGDSVEIALHPGALGWSWVSSVRRLP